MRRANTPMARRKDCRTQSRHLYAGARRRGEEESLNSHQHEEHYGSAAAGKGTLYYNGRRHHFTISGLGAGGMGGQKISATGKVYNLNNLSDFSGTYHGVSRGLTLIEGKMHVKLTNGNGVVMYLADATEAWPPPWECRHLRSR